MGYLLKEVLKTLCGVNQWSYAVFWKMGCQNPNLLIWEECYYEAASSFDSLTGFSGKENLDINFQDYNNSSVQSESLNLQAALPARGKVHILVNKMLADGNVKVVGEGLVGRVAFTGNYQWILSENYCGEPQSLEVLKEALQQFSAGMQTVTIVPVLPHGVVQFGSHVAIPENIGFVKDVASLILELGNIPGVLQSENHEAKELMHGLLPLGSNLISISSYSADSFRSPEYLAQTSGFGNDLTSFQASNLVGSSHLETYETKITAPHLTSPNQFTNGVSNNFNAWTNLQSASMNTRVPKKGLATTGLKDPKISGLLNFHDAVDQCEGGLFDALGTDFKEKMLNSHTVNEPEKMSLPDFCPPGPVKLESGILSFKGADHLQEAMVSKGKSNRSLDESVSCMSSLTNISDSYASKALFPQGLFGNFDHEKGELFGTSNYKGKEVSSTYSQGSCVYDPWAAKGFGLKQIESLASGHSTKPNVSSKPSRKRSKPGENPRPRPRDRQMIQDRVKELREIVPNGAKCSIDCLLQRTIKHMLFLQGVTKHADKLKQTTESKIISKDGGSHLKDNTGGVTWAYEVGSQSMICPIIVEDISQQPHQMLVEMVCEERDSFLEIAGIIRGLGLSILKGIIENRDGKVWAHFTVEANRNVTRIEILLSLVRLLDKNVKHGFSKSNVQTENVMVQDCQQAASVIC
ncbi:Transcription factor LHW [Striga hermonthica]|uniref:Transcription factor LHW n=1 Tax=Striga hermonthica TaxID=68872 RepID=A0A9N7RR79_STRHE|nr:Transcription factor LHW [Striga hermonthica]